MRNTSLIMQGELGDEKAVCVGDGREGGMSGGSYFFCADVALGSCSMALCFAFSPLLPL